MRLLGAWFNVRVRLCLDSVILRVFSKQNDSLIPWIYNVYSDVVWLHEMWVMLQEGKMIPGHPMCIRIDCRKKEHTWFSRLGINSPFAGDTVSTLKSFHFRKRPMIICNPAQRYLSILGGTLSRRKLSSCLFWVFLCVGLFVCLFSLHQAKCISAAKLQTLQIKELDLLYIFLSVDSYKYITNSQNCYLFCGFTQNVQDSLWMTGKHWLFSPEANIISHNNHCFTTP